jgi:hypothetical protein
VDHLQVRALSLYHGGRVRISGDHDVCIASNFGHSRTFNNGHVVALGSSPLLAREWTHGATKYIVKLVKECIESYGTMVFKQQHWERIREHVIKDHPSEALLI